MEGEYVEGNGKSGGRRGNMEAEVEEVEEIRSGEIRRRKLKESCHWLAETCKSYRTSSA